LLHFCAKVTSRRGVRTQHAWFFRKGRKALESRERPNPRNGWTRHPHLTVKRKVACLCESVWRRGGNSQQHVGGEGKLKKRDCRKRCKRARIVSGKGTACEPKSCEIRIEKKNTQQVRAFPTAKRRKPALRGRKGKAKRGTAGGEKRNGRNAKTNGFMGGIR